MVMIYVIQADEVEVEIDPKEIELTTARSGGAGGIYPKTLGICLMSLLERFDLSLLLLFGKRIYLSRISCRAKCQQG